ncbi:MAG: family transporter protein, partial [Pedosphaera sp.]|nr:family transporter protein [Pedosphaera sp.]
MSVLPIVDRELRVAARRAGTYWMRFWAALSVLALWLILLLNSNLSSPAQMGHHLLNALGILALIFSMLAGVFLTSDCLSEEKREGTLGLLFLTDLRAYDVVLGKLAAHSLHAFFGLLAIVPVLGLALLIGGVTGQEFSRLALVFVTTLFFSLGMGMVVSAVNSEAKHAIAGSFLLIMLFAGVLPALWWFQQMLLRIGALDVLLLPSPVFAYIKGFDAEYHSTNGARAFWSSVGTLFGLGLGGIVLANLVLPRSWPERSRKRSTMPPFPSLRGYSPKAAFKGWPVFHLDEPIYWLAVRDVSPRLAERTALL